MDHAITLGRLRDEPCPTKNLRIHGYVDPSAVDDEDPLQVYGSDADAIRSIARNPDLARQLHPELPYVAAEAVWAARDEMAQTVEDVLARRTRALFLNARAASEMAPAVAKLLALELERDSVWVTSQIDEFRALARQYTV